MPAWVSREEIFQTVLCQSGRVQLYNTNYDQLTRNQKDVSQQDVRLTLWLWTLTSRVTLALDFQGQFLNTCLSGMGKPINMERKGYDRILYLLCDLELYLWPWICEGQILKMLCHRNKRMDWHGTKRMWVDRMLDPSCDFKLWYHPWPWPWIFKVKFLIAIF